MPMRRALIAGGVLTATLVLGTLALAQPRPGRSGHSAARPSAPEKHAPPASPSSPLGDAPSEGKSPAAESGSGNSLGVGGPSDAGSPPGSGVAFPPAISDGGARLSPLTPAANEFWDAGAASPSADYELLLSDLASLRARVAAVSDTLFHSRISLSLETSADHASITALSVSLDDGTVWSSPQAFQGREAAVIYDHAVAPGHHAVTLDVDYREEGDIFRSSQRSRFVVDVPADERLVVEMRLWDDSSMNGFSRDKKGQYDLRIQARELAQPLGR